MKVTVKYWLGTTRMEGTAMTYRGAMRIASRNENAFPARFYDEEGRELAETGYGLAYIDGGPDSDVVMLAD